MHRRICLGVGALLVVGLCGCSSDDPAPGSEVAKGSAGNGGMGGLAGSLSLGVEAGTGGGGMAGGGAGGVGGTGSLGGSGTGGLVSGGGSSSSSAGSGGSKAQGTCKRVSGSDADCTEFAEEPSQAYACDDRASYTSLNGMHGNLCINLSGLVPGAAVGACCPP